MIKRIQVKETKRYWGEFEGTLESIISSLQAELDAGWEGIEEEHELTKYSDYYVHYLYKFREETDKEYEKRMKLLKKEKAQKLKEKEQKKERRLKEYEKLKKEFGDT